MEKSLKQQIVNAAEAVKKKVQRMRDIEDNNTKSLETVFKPLISPLNEIASHKKRKLENSSEKTSKTEKKYFTKQESHWNNSRNEIENDDYSQNKSEEFETNDENEHSFSNENTFSNEDMDNNLNDSGDSYKTLENNDSPIQNVSSWSLSSEAFEDVPFGIRIEKGKPMLGSALVNIDDKTINIAGTSYGLTPGLKELLFKKVPNLNIINESDKHNYKLMLMVTNAHRRDFDAKKPIKSNKGLKYMQIIKPLFKLYDNLEFADRSVRRGNGLSVLKKWNKNVDYVYWDDPNELVDRLKLLIASRDAGNTGLDNDIISIIEELREGGYLK